MENPRVRKHPGVFLLFWVRSAGTIPSDTKSLAITARGGNEEDTRGTPAPQAYFLTDEKVGKESPGNFRRFPGPFGRPKGEADKLIYYQRFRRFPLGNPRGGAEG